MFIATEVKESGIYGKGLFAAQVVKKGTVVCCFTVGSSIITEQQFIQACEIGDRHIMRTGTRYVGKYFTIGNEDAQYTYINHAFEPNLLCHCGIVLALRDLAVGEELTMDYTTLIDPTDVAMYDDSKTGREIRGLPAKDAILRSARKLIQLVEGIEGWEG